MGDVSRQNKGMLLSIYAFTTEDVELLMNVLETKFNFKCSIHRLGKKPRIYVWEESMDKVRHHLCPYIIPSMRYKIEIINK